jgi:hypothetical protein
MKRQTYCKDCRKKTGHECTGNGWWQCGVCAKFRRIQRKGPVTQPREKREVVPYHLQEDAVAAREAVRAHILRVTSEK